MPAPATRGELRRHLRQRERGIEHVGAEEEHEDHPRGFRRADHRVLDARHRQLALDEPSTSVMAAPMAAPSVGVNTPP